MVMEKKRIIYVVGCISTSFILLPNNILMYGNIIFCLSVYIFVTCSSVEGHFYFLVIMNNTAMNINLCIGFWMDIDF